jgi:hypothetical protein
MSIVRGAKSIGMSLTDAGIVNTIPAVGKDVETIVAELISKFENMVPIIEGKADADKLRTLVAYSDEAIRIQAQDIVLVGNVTLAAIENERNGTTSGTLPISITQIIGDKIRTGTITSNNWGSSAGTAIDLNAGNITIGGSTAPKLLFNGTTGDLTISGTLTAGAVIAGTVSITGVGGVSTVADLAGGLDASGVNALLAAGVNNVLAGLSGDYRMDAGSSGVTIRHNLAQYNTTIGGYAGVLRTGLAITANGIAAGYNRTSDGAWVNSFAIDSSGNATFGGTITANSIITNSCTVNGVAIGTVQTQAAAGNTLNTTLTTNAQLTLIGQIVPSTTGGIKLGTITWNSTTGALTGGSGIAITAAGIIGAQSGVAKFSIDTSGNATFSGNITGATGTFSGNLSGASITGTTGTFSADINTTGRVYAKGATNDLGFSAAISAEVAAASSVGVLGVNTKDLGIAAQFSTAAWSTGTALKVIATSSGTGVEVSSVGGAAINITSGRFVKPNVAGHLVKIYDETTNALVATYRYEFL